MAWARGEVVLIPFPFSDLSATKTRPVVIVSTPKYHSVRQELILVYLTSQISSPHPEFDYLLADWQTAGLLKPTLMQPRLAIIRSELVQHRVGRLTRRDLAEVDERLRRVLGLVK